MSKKTSQFLSKLWKMTPFYILSLPGKQESQAIEQNLQNILKSYSIFEKNILGNFNDLKNLSINIPVLVKVRNQLIKSKGRIQKFIKQQSECVGNIINILSQFRFLLQKSEMNATNEYSEKIQYFLNSKEEGVSSKKIEKVHDEIMGLKYNEKCMIKNSFMNSDFEKWLADFSIRSEDFYMKAYSVDWQLQVTQTKPNERPLIKLKSAQEMESLIFKLPQIQSKQQEPEKQTVKRIEHFIQPVGLTVKIEQNFHKEYKESDMESEEESNDIVSQIYNELEYGQRMQA